MNFIIKHKSLILLVVLIIFVIGWFKSYSSLKGQLEQRENYISALEDNLNGKTTELNMTRAQLLSSKDSINKLIAGKIKEKGYAKTVVKVERITSTVSKLDSVFFHDTIFAPGIKFDTVIGDNYYKVSLRGEYPRSMYVEPEVNSELYLITHIEKEFVNQPSKIFFIRWFQKKRKISVTDIEEANPYIKLKESRVIQVQE